MDIGNKVKNLFNELIDIPFSLLYLLETPNESKRDYQNNTMKPLTNDLMKPIPSAKPFLGFGIREKDKPPIGMRDFIDMENYVSPFGYVSSHNKPEIKVYD